MRGQQFHLLGNGPDEIPAIGAGFVPEHFPRRFREPAQQVRRQRGRDPVDGLSRALGVAVGFVALGLQGCLLYTSACGPGLPPGVIDLDRSPAENIQALAEAKGVAASEITVCVLDRPRHAEIIAGVRAAGARIQLITDGDVAGVINTTDPSTGIDLYLGSGGAPEGVLACAALKCVGGQFQGRLLFRNADERARAARWGVTELDKKYDLHEIVRDEAIFAATGVTRGGLLRCV